MGGGWLARVRWRRRGAWLWPAFIAATLADGLVGHLLPPAGESQTVASALLIGLFLNLIGVIATAIVRADELTSLWCLYAAFVSVLILEHFRRQRASEGRVRRTPRPLDRMFASSRRGSP